MNTPSIPSLRSASRTAPPRLASVAILAALVAGCAESAGEDPQAAATARFKGTWDGSGTSDEGGQVATSSFSLAIDGDGRIAIEWLADDRTVGRLEGDVEGDVATVDGVLRVGACDITVEGTISRLTDGSLALDLEATACGGAPFSLRGSARRAEVVVNGVLLDAATLERLARDHGLRPTGAALDELRRRLVEQAWGVAVEPGRYWYDPVSGLWGIEGLFALGQIPAGLALGGPLSEAASGSLTDVLLNGRSLHPVELAFLESLLGDIPPGRYFLLESGEYGEEGGEVEGSIARPAGGGRRSILGHSDVGSVIGGDGIVGFIDGATGVTCGPDGGCIY